MTDDKTQDLSTAALGLLVELLAARDRANAVRDELSPLVRRVVDPLGVWTDLARGVTAADVRNLAFDVARLQVTTLTELTKQGEELSRRFVQRLKDAKRPAPVAPGGTPERLLVCNLRADVPGGPYRGSFVAPGRVTALPGALVLRPVDGGAEFPVGAAFERRHDPNGERLHVSIDADAWIEQGKRYQARLPLTGTDTVACFKLVGQ